MKIVIPDPIAGLPPETYQQLKTLHAQVYHDHTTVFSEIAARIQDAEIITANYTIVTAELLTVATKLRYIIAPSVGYDWIDTVAARQHGITVLNCPTFVPLPVAEHAFALLMSLAKRLPESTRQLSSGVWDTNRYVSTELFGKRLGLVGYGNIGKHVERMAQGFGMVVDHTNSLSSAEQLDTLLQTADFICLCLPLTDATHHLIDKRRLELLKPTAFIINVARGAVIDQVALLDHLRNGRIAGAGLDVFEQEPATANAQLPQIIQDLVALPNVIATAHRAFNTPEALARKGAEILADIRSCLDGQPINVVN